MSVPTLRDYPHLPLLTIEQCLSVFRTARINFQHLAALSGYSRMSWYLWRKRDRTPHPHALDLVNTLAYRALACLRDRTMPIPPRSSIEHVKVLLDAVNLDERVAEKLLPKDWLPNE